MNDLAWRPRDFFDFGEHEAGFNGIADWWWRRSVPYAVVVTPLLIVAIFLHFAAAIFIPESRGEFVDDPPFGLIGPCCGCVFLPLPLWFCFSLGAPVEFLLRLVFPRGARGVGRALFGIGLAFTAVIVLIALIGSAASVVIALRKP